MDATESEFLPLVDTVKRCWQVVVNDEEQFSIWPLSTPLPAGWKSEGYEGPEDSCLDHIARIWLDMTPRSLRGPRRSCTSSADTATAQADASFSAIDDAKPDSSSRICRVGENPHAVMRLYCFAHAGGGANIFNGWEQRVPREVEVVPVELSGRGRRFDDPLVSDIDHHIDEIACELASHPAVPAAFFGHSMGALIAYEVIRSLRTLGKPSPLCLIVSAHRAPHLPDRQPALHTLDDAALLEKLRDWSGTADAILANDTLLSIFLPILRADLAAAAAYTHKSGPPLPCPIIAYGASDDDEANIIELQGWRAQTEAEFTFRVFSGGHFFINRSEFIHDLGSELNRISAALSVKKLKGADESSERGGDQHVA